MTYKPWGRKELADIIEQTRRSSSFQGAGEAHPVCLLDEYWTMICEALRSETVKPELAEYRIELAKRIRLALPGVVPQQSTHGIFLKLVEWEHILMALSDTSRSATATLMASAQGPAGAATVTASTQGHQFNAAGAETPTQQCAVGSGERSLDAAPNAAPQGSTTSGQSPGRDPGVVPAVAAPVPGGDKDGELIAWMEAVEVGQHSCQIPCGSPAAPTCSCESKMERIKDVLRSARSSVATNEPFVLRDAAQRMADAVGAHDNQNMPWSCVRSARENLLSALKGLPSAPSARVEKDKILVSRELVKAAQRTSTDVVVQIALHNALVDGGGYVPPSSTEAKGG